MNSSTVKLLASGMLLLLLSACAPYHQTYYSAGGNYSGYGVTQRSYYGGYPYRYDNHSYPYNSNYHYDDDHHRNRHDDYNSNPSWNNGYVRPNSSNDYLHNHPDRKHQRFSYRSSVPAHPDHKDHHDQHGNNNWSKPSVDRSWEHNNPQHSRLNSDRQNYGQNQRPADDRRNQIKELQHYDHDNGNRVRYENHEQAKDQRGSHRRNHYQ